MLRVTAYLVAKAVIYAAKRAAAYLKAAIYVYFYVALARACRILRAITNIRWGLGPTRAPAAAYLAARRRGVDTRLYTDHTAHTL